MYVVLGYVGGIFADADVVPLKAPEHWLQGEFGALHSPFAKDVRLMVGVEGSGSDDDAKNFRWAGRVQLTNWAAAAAPGHPVMLRAIDRYLRTPGPARNQGAQEHYKQSIAMGPGLLTLMVDHWLREFRSSSSDCMKTCGLEGLESVTGTAQSILLGDTIVLGIDGFGCGQAHSRSRPCNVTSTALVQHLFMGAWKPVEVIPWYGIWDEEEGGRRRRRVPGPGEYVDWREPASALMTHLQKVGMNLPWEAVKLLFSRLIPIEPPLLPKPPHSHRCSAAMTHQSRK